MPAGQAPTTDIGTPDLWFATEGQGLQSEWWETTPALMWPESVITYSRMRHDPQLRAVLQAYMLPILRANWAVDPSGCRDEVVQQVADDLGMGILGKDDKPGPARRQGVIWTRHLNLALDHLVFGHMPFELRYRIDNTKPGGTHLDHLGVRMPWTIARIMLNRDATIKEVYQSTQNTPIPASRMIWYVLSQEGANWAGISMLRPAFGAWLLKHEMWRVHGTSIRRFGMGVPYVEAPAGATAAQVAQAQQLASSMRAGDTAGIGLPQGFKPMLMGVTGTVPSALEFIRYLDQSMAKMALAGLIELGQTQTGSRALGETFLDLFLLSLQAVADEIATTATSGQDGMPGICTDLVAQNWGEDEPVPRVACTDVGEGYQVTAQAISMLMAAHALTPDPDLEAWVRRTWRLPDQDPQPGQSLPWAPAVPGGPGGQGGPGGSPPDTGTPRPAGPRPAGFADSPTVKPPAPSLSVPVNPSRGGVSAAAGGPLHRPVSAAEAASGFDPAGHQASWQQQLTALIAAYRPVLRAQEQGLVDAVVSAVESGNPERLGALVPDSAAGASLIRQAMVIVAQEAADATLAEAASQGVYIAPEQVAVSQVQLGRLAQVYAGLAAARMGQVAGKRAAQFAVTGAKTEPGQVGDEVHAALAQVSDRPLADELGAALTAAQNHGRLAALAAAPEAAGQAEYVASEILDKNTCGPCRAIDGALFTSLPEAASAYPNGGYLGCQGGMRCRGTVIAVWSAAPGSANVGLAAAWAAAQPADAEPEVPGGESDQDGPPKVVRATAMTMIGDLITADWRADLHPRDRHGRWAHKGAIPGLPGPAVPREQHVTNVVRQRVMTELGNLDRLAPGAHVGLVRDNLQHAARELAAGNRGGAAAFLSMAADRAAKEKMAPLADRLRHLAVLAEPLKPQRLEPASPDPDLGDRIVKAFRAGKYDNVRAPLAQAVQHYHGGHFAQAQDMIDLARQHAQENGQQTLAEDLVNLRDDIGARHGQAFRQGTLPSGEPAPGPSVALVNDLEREVEMAPPSLRGLVGIALENARAGNYAMAEAQLRDVIKLADGYGHTAQAGRYRKLAARLEMHQRPPDFTPAVVHLPSVGSTQKIKEMGAVGVIRDGKWKFDRTPKPADVITDAHGDRGVVFGVSDDGKWITAQWAQTVAGGDHRREIINTQTGEVLDSWYAHGERDSQGANWVRVRNGLPPVDYPSPVSRPPTGGPMPPGTMTVHEMINQEMGAFPSGDPAYEALRRARVFHENGDLLGAAIAVRDASDMEKGRGHAAEVKRLNHLADQIEANWARHGGAAGEVKRAPAPGTPPPVGHASGKQFSFDRPPRAGDEVGDNFGARGQVVKVSDDRKWVAIEYDDGRRQVLQMRGSDARQGQVKDTWWEGESRPGQRKMWDAVMTGKDPTPKPPARPKAPAPAGRDDAKAAKELAADVAQGPADTWTGATGAQAETEFARFPDGDKGVHKTFMEWDGTSAEDMASAEYLSGQVAAAIGDTGAPPVLRGSGDDEVWMGFVDGQVAGDWLDSNGYDSWDPPPELFDNARSYHIGLLDYVIHNDDRHSQNYMFAGDEPVAIDNSSSWGIEGGGQAGPFRAALAGALDRGEHPFDAAELAAIEKRYAALEPLFASAGHEDWWQQGKDRLADAAAGHITTDNYS